MVITRQSARKFRIDQTYAPRFAAVRRGHTTWPLSISHRNRYVLDREDRGKRNSTLADPFGLNDSACPVFSTCPLLVLFVPLPLCDRRSFPLVRGLQRSKPDHDVYPRRSHSFWHDESSTDRRFKPCKTTTVPKESRERNNVRVPGYGTRIDERACSRLYFVPTEQGTDRACKSPVYRPTFLYETLVSPAIRRIIILPEAG